MQERLPRIDETPSSDALLRRMQALHPRAIDLSLGRLERLLATLDHPERRLPPVIHIAGTNGKGSVLAMIRAGLEAAGDAVHAYTSPHLVSFHERIRLRGDLIGEADLAAVLSECLAANGDAPITQFEITTAAAFLAFARRPADRLLLEVGLGGRLDATNVVDAPELTIITPVALDHQGFLGDTLPQIAGEKAGILKRGVPCIVGRQEDAAMDVIEARAARLGAPLVAHGQHWHVAEESERLVFQDERGLLDLPRPVLAGPHQVENAGMAIAALRHLGHGEETAEAALRGVVWPARLQRLRKGPLVGAAGRAELWLDGGHNPAAGAALADALTQLPPRPLHLICGMLSTKDTAGYLRPFAGKAASLRAIAIPGEANSLPAEELRRTSEEIGLRARAASGVEGAVREIVMQEPAARIVICGSLYLAGHVLTANG